MGIFLIDMKTIPLTQGKCAKVSDIDYKYLMQWKWCAEKINHGFYAYRKQYLGKKKGKVIQKTIRMHCVISGAVKTDHRDGDGLNNQRRNLREVTNSQNMMNQRKTRGSSRYKGVYWCERDGYWIVQISSNNKRMFVEYFKKHEEKLAAISYNKAAKKYHGKYAKLNII